MLLLNSTFFNDFIPIRTIVILLFTIHSVSQIIFLTFYKYKGLRLLEGLYIYIFIPQLEDYGSY